MSKHGSSLHPEDDSFENHDTTADGGSHFQSLAQAPKGGGAHPNYGGGDGDGDGDGEGDGDGGGYGGGYSPPGGYGGYSPGSYGSYSTRYGGTYQTLSTDTNYSEPVAQQYQPGDVRPYEGIILQRTSQTVSLMQPKRLATRV